jgi:RND family efflux transporter MFP subunit
MQAVVRKVARKTMLMSALRAVPPSPPRPRRWPFAVAGLAILLLALAAVRRIQERGEGGSVESSDSAVREVQVIRPEAVGTQEVTLPATLHANQSTDLYPRVDGFVKAWTAEIGSRVRAGQLLAEIDTPELDQEVARAEAQVNQALADLEQAKAELEEARSEVALADANGMRARANLEFAAGQAERLRRLAGTRAASKEEYERTSSDRDARAADTRAAQADLARRKSALGTRQAAIVSKEATLANQRANVRRLHELQGFKRIIAPFDGLIARRNAEVGILVTAGTTANARPLFRVVQADVLRVQLPMPQAFAAQVRAGDRASVVVPEQPGRAFPARVARISGEIDPATRTVLVELELPNRDGALLAGTYAQVKIDGKRADRAWVVPTSAVLLRSDGAQVAVVSGGEVRMQKIELGRDHGNKVEVLGGLTGREELVANPTDDLHDGSKVEVRRAAEVAQLSL